MAREGRGTALAELTFAQIIDGLPTKASSYHAELCPGVVKKTRQIRDAFDPMSFTFKTELLSAFQRMSPNMQKFELRLLEMLADACHQIASYLYSLDNGVHKHSLYYTWRDFAEPASPDPRLLVYRAPTPFYHLSYQDFNQYPNGISDVVGYWAEAKIIGGVMVFDRGESGTECRDVFLHSCYVNGPATIHPPTPRQYDALISFLVTPANPDISCPLPIHATSENRWRWDPFDAITKYHIFRDRYERKPPRSSIKDGCVHRASNWPETGDEMIYTLKQYRAAQGEESFDQAERERLEENMNKITPSSPLWRGKWEW
ncbi:hypothetical protein B0T25DRAFT_588984 [Lasiosphaeria hispida]|uniref:Uncharacterized protein n=1 Tax=Lasiosphaeria hispida TaxID=260671 RepID=A0AAJ0HST5_9PEZI|nr:hypothetical protein B0T25DRAFT_588984 [Lasiosphaeria hispida]